MERLHADKHKLEDRLRLLEKVQLYEESSSGWVEEGGEGGEGKWEATLMLCADSGGKEEKTESDIGVRSLPHFVYQLHKIMYRYMPLAWG